MTVLTDYLAEQVALFPVADRVAPSKLGYGTDVSCVLDLASDLTMVDPQSTRAIGEAIIRRLITPRGALIDDGAYGTDLRGKLNTGMTQREISQLELQVRGEALKDDRVSEAQATIVMTQMRQMRVSLALTPVLSTQPFVLTFFVTADGIQLQESIGKNG